MEVIAFVLPVTYSDEKYADLFAKSQIMLIPSTKLPEETLADVCWGPVNSILDRLPSERYFVSGPYSSIPHNYRVVHIVDLYRFEH